MIDDYTGKNVLVLGLGETGLSMARFLARRGAKVSIADTRERPPRLDELRSSLPRATVHLGGFPAEAFAQIDLLAISPGVPLADPPVRQAALDGVPVAGDVELFAQALRRRGPVARRSRIAAITGTNGKSTVTALLGDMCRAAGPECEVAGNIGPAVLDALERREAHGAMPAVWILELSSFQLETTSSLDATAAAMLNLSEDHLDRYASVAEYASAKARVFRGSGVQVLNRGDARSLSMAVAGRAVVTFGLDAPPTGRDFGLIEHAGESWLAHGSVPVLAARELPIAGSHNAANALAALALAHALGLAAAPLAGALRRFRGLSHRVQPAGEARGVRFYDDSKGTNVGAAIAALVGLAGGNGRIVLIAGGEGKGQDFSPLRRVVADCARAVVLIGRDAAQIAAALQGAGIPLRLAPSMEEAVAAAFAEAQSGDCVLLSPACASFDMFRDYRHRGEVFQAAVRRLVDAKAR